MARFSWGTRAAMHHVAFAASGPRASAETGTEGGCRKMWEGEGWCRGMQEGAGGCGNTWEGAGGCKRVQ